MKGRRTNRPPPERLALTLMGRFEVRRGPGPAVMLPSRRARALLAYLGLPPGRAHGRDKLTGLFWPEADEDHARHSLRQTVLELRKNLAGLPCLVTQGDALELDAQAVDVDVSRFDRLVLETAPDALERAAALYGGDLLEGFHTVTVPFEEWLLGQRERLRQALVTVLSTLLGRQMDGPAEPAVRTALRLLALDPVQETVHRALMRLYTRQGRRTAALRQYQICAATLRRELDVAPDGETEQLYRELLRLQARSRHTNLGLSRRPTRRTTAGRDLFPPPPQTPFVGREVELVRLCRALDDASRRQGCAILIVGEAGIGKTSLLLRLVADTARRGGRALIASCHESEQIIPLGPWVEALRPAITTEAPQILGGLPEAFSRELTRLFPALDVPGAGTPAVSTDRRPLFESIAAILDHLATTGPVVLALEDVQWADDLSLRLLSYLSHRIGHRPVLLVATAREEDLDSVPGIRRFVDEMNHAVGRLERVSLGPLSRSHTLELLHVLVRGQTADIDATSERVWRASEGNPLVVVEIARALEAGDLAYLDGPAVLPPRVRELITARLERLSENAQRVLAAAAVSGRESSLNLLQHVTGLADAAVIEALRELIRHRVLNADGNLFAFTHERVRKVAYDRLFEAHRRSLHRAVAEAIERLDRNHLDDVADRLAHHYAHAEHAPKAVEYLVRFAEEAARRYSLEDAVRALGEAMRLAGRLPRDERDLCLLDLSLRQAFALSVLGRFQEILDLLLPQQARLQSLDAPPALTGPYHCRLALTYSYLGAQENAARHAAVALATAQRSGDIATAGRARYTLALSNHALGNLRTGVEHAKAAIEALEQARDQYWLGLAYWVLGMNHAVLGEFEAGLRAVVLAEQVGALIDDARVRALATSTRGWFHALRGDIDEAAAACTQGLEMARDPISVAAALRRLGMTYLEAGDARTAVAKLEEWLQRLRGLGAQLGLPQGLAALGEAHLLCGNAVQARMLAQESLTAASEDALGAGCARRLLGLIARADGRLDDAESQLAQARRAFEAIGARLEIARTHVAQAELAMGRGRTQVTLEHLAAGHRLFRALNVPRRIERLERFAREAGVSVTDTAGEHECAF